MPYKFILYGKSEGIAWITFNRPGKMNALCPEMLDEWRDALLAAEKDNEVGVVVVTGSGRAYCSGLDLKALEAEDLKDGAVGPAYDIPGRAVIDTMLNLSKVVIAMVNGVCATGGLETLLAFDLVVASESASFCDSHARWGVRPSWGMSQRLPRTVGLMRARELSFTARFFPASEALQMGLVNRVVPAEKLREETISLAKSILENSLESVAAIKSLYNRGILTTLKEGLRIEEESRFTITDTKLRLGEFLKRK
ncbi:MAG: enoyl-CoA hydratase/isomerase family protein [Syntrophaceae bacterium]